jgi:hypothetical protein
MRTPYPFRHGLGVAALTTVAAFALTGCQTPEPDGTDVPSATAGPSTVAGSPSTTTGSPTPPPSATTASAKALPDVCSLLSRAEVIKLAGGKPMLSVDPDPAAPGATVRYCQWQLSGARLGVQLSYTTDARFGQDRSGAESVTGLGDEAQFYSNHLFVRKGTIEVDVYASTAEGVANDKRVAKEAAAMVVARL